MTGWVSPGRRRASAAAAAAFLAGTALAACGSGNSGEDSEAGGALTPITVYRAGGGQFHSTVLAEELGYFEEAGFDATLEVAGGDPTENIPLMLNDQAQFVMMDAATIVRSASEGVPVQLISAVKSAEAGESPTDGLLVPGDSPIESLSDLDGATVGTSALGGTPHVMNNMALKEAGVDPDTVDYIQLPVDSLAESAAEGDIDAFVTFAHFYQFAVDDGFNALTGGANETLPASLQVAYSASSQYLAENPDDAQAFIEALDRAHEYLSDNPEEFRRIDHEYTELPEDYIDNRELPILDSGIDVEAVETLAHEMYEQGFVDSEPAADDMIWSEAWTR